MKNIAYFLLGVVLSIPIPPNDKDVFYLNLTSDGALGANVVKVKVGG
jgi:hypothetical protein